MGIIIKQSIKGTIWSYLGVTIGFITTGYLFPEYLTPDVIGLFSVLMAYSILFAQLSSLGFNGVTGRLFPYFREKKEKHNGYVFLLFAIITIGFTLFLIVFNFYYPTMIERSSEKSFLFVDYARLIIPITLFLLIFTALDIYNRLLYDAVLGTFLQEFFQRILILIATILFIFKLINLHQFIIAYAVAVSLKTVVIFIFLLYKKQLNFKPQLGFVSKKLKKEMLSVAIFSVLTGLGSSVVLQLDKIIINEMMGLEQTGIYSIAFFFGTLVIIPSRTLLKISGTLIADSWKKNNIDLINRIYKQTAINQFIMGIFLFGGIWVNIDNIIQVLGAEYAEGRWIIFFIGLAYVTNMAMGANAQIIAYSKHYRSYLWFTLVLIAFVVSTLLIFIPIWGITGAAISIALSFFTNNVLRYIFLYRKYKMQSLNYSFLIVIAITIFAYIITLLIPKFPLVIDILIRSITFTILFLIATVITRVSTDINQLLKNIIDRKRIKN